MELVRAFRTDDRVRPADADPTSGQIAFATGIGGRWQIFTIAPGGSGGDTTHQPAQISSNVPTNREVISKPRHQGGHETGGMSVSGNFRVRFGCLTGVGCMNGLRHAGWARR